MIIEINTEEKVVVIKSEFLLDDLMEILQKFNIWDYKIRPYNSSISYKPWVTNPWITNTTITSNRDTMPLSGSLSAEQFHFTGEDKEEL